MGGGAGSGEAASPAASGRAGSGGLCPPQTGSRGREGWVRGSCCSAVVPRGAGWASLHWPGLSREPLRVCGAASAPGRASAPPERGSGPLPSVGLAAGGRLPGPLRPALPFLPGPRAAGSALVAARRSARARRVLYLRACNGRGQKAACRAVQGEMMSVNSDPWSSSDRRGILSIGSSLMAQKVWDPVF